MIAKLKERRAAVKASLEALSAKAETETRGFNEAENAEFDAGLAEIRQIDARIAELQEAEVREAAAAAHHVALGAAEERVSVVNEPNPVYRKDGAQSFFGDLFRAKVQGDTTARSRLVAAQETRAGDLTTVAGAGGQFAPPLWLIEDFVALARPGRVTADLTNKQELPGGVSSVNLPTVATGTSVGVQATQNSAVSQTDLTSSSVSSSITTIAGQQVIALQLLQQSGIPFDQVILGDLARAYAVALDGQVLNGSGSSGELTGILNTSGVNAQTYTQATPTVTGAGQFYSQVVQAINLVNTNRYLPPTAIVMHPRRWAWVLNALDTANRPLVVPNGPAFNQLATGSDVVAQGVSGTLLGLPVYVDPNIPTDLGAGTNEDRVLVLRADDLWLYETALSTASFDATYANQASVLYRALAYSAFIPNRYPKSISVIAGTGLVTPTF